MNSSKITIGIDVMGGDNYPISNMEGALQALKYYKNQINIALIGDEVMIKKELPSAENVIIYPTTEIINMNDDPGKAYRSKIDSSINKGFELLKKNKIDAFGSAGHSGAMIAGSYYASRPINGVIRPCSTAILPKINGEIGILLDAGTIVDCKPDVLYQFGILGSIYAECVYGITAPKVGLLNIGSEEGKGNLATQAAYELMKESLDFNFIGNIEGRNLFDNKADIIICDGFTGNIVLKEAESFFRLLKKRQIKDKYFDRFNYENYGGTPILGINHSVLIGHGISNANAIENMIKLAVKVVEVNLTNKLKLKFNEEYN